MNTQTNTEIDNAIARSISEDTIVTLPYTTELHDALVARIDANDWTDIGDGVTDYWMVNADNENEMDWRVQLTDGPYA